MNENETNVVEQPASIPFYAHEGEINRLERINKRFFILLLIVFFALVGTNAYWILKHRLLDGLTFERLAEKHDLSVRQTKTIVYKREKILFKHIPG